MKYATEKKVLVVWAVLALVGCADRTAFDDRLEAYRAVLEDRTSLEYAYARRPACLLADPGVPCWPLGARAYLYEALVALRAAYDRSKSCRCDLGALGPAIAEFDRRYVEVRDARSVVGRW